MFIVSLTYICAFEEIEKHLANHMNYLDRQYTAGKFLASGRKNPRTGGVILAAADSRKELDIILSEDPFNVHNLANYEVTEFIVSKAKPELHFLLE
jgi:uncharacterized protein YciI